MKNILIIRLSALGDLITFEPIFRIMRDFHKDAKITFLTSSIGKELYEDTGYFDDIVLFKTVNKSVKELKNKKFETILNLQCTSASHFVTLCLNKENLVNRNSNLFQKLFGVKREAKTFETMLLQSYVSQDAINKYQENNSFKIQFYAKQISFFENKKVVAISTGSSKRWISKRWGVENFSALVKILIQNGCEVILVGTKLEVEDSKIILAQNTSHVKDFVDKTTLKELKSILKSADLYIGNDSGPSHISACVGTDTITIFGSTSQKHCVKNWPYFGAHEFIIPDNNVTCFPCYKSICPKKDDEYMKCMKSISVQNVANMALAKLVLKNKI